LKIVETRWRKAMARAALVGALVVGFVSACAPPADAQSLASPNESAQPSTPTGAPAPTAPVAAAGSAVSTTTATASKTDPSAQPATSAAVLSNQTLGEVRGFIQDEAGAPVLGALITIHAIGDGSDQRIASVGLGAFAAEGLKPGRYQVTASKAGFSSSKTSTIEVTAEQGLRVNLTLVRSTATLPSQPIAYPARRELASASQPAAAPATNTSAANASGLTPSGQPSSSAQPALPAEVQQQLMAMEKRIEDLEEALKERDSSAANAAAAPLQVEVQPAASSTSTTPATVVFDPQKQTKSDPFAWADWTWMNSVSRNKDTPLATKYFTPEVRFDTNFIEDYNQPKDHTMGGSTESFRSDEIQLEQVSFGGDIHVDNVRGRVLTMAGLFATTTPRNDGSAGVGQWNLNDAYKYFSEAWGGYHFNVNHGLNIDAGIFVSYIGLFSYYNFDNWTYQPSFVSSNTPWFFNGVRIQWFPTDKLKIEPWIINGWQSYAKTNGHPGLGGQILYRPQQWVSLVFNNYGMGTDTLGVPGRSRIHTDDSVEVKYFDRPDGRTPLQVDKMAFTVTGDAGCEYGGGVSCHNDSHGNPKQMFLGWMLYDRTWFHKDLFAMTLGGGAMNNPGRYLTLLPPINGATAVSGSPYFPADPGSKYKGWDSTVTFDYMPSQFITFRFETGYRYANVPYWSGRGGITPPGGNVGPVANNGSVGTAASYICTNGATSAVSDFSPSGNGFTVDNAGNAVANSCATQYGNPWTAWQPDLRKSQWANTIAIMVKW
jgi:Putative beta-barrel porin-2, OmpL-like. bbp2/Carboxypeptidase regulatory-like domain